MTITRRIAAGFALAAAPAVIFLGAATANAEASQTNAGPSVSHPAFPHQHNFPQPGTSVHHHHQNNHAK
ncbi:hypothetical protein [Mycolicibacterium mageritense]|uniref:Secreted protein n=1 Tax=Mycolicibacterium mageritense TaxID=53462 RepID=A0AAI8XPA4_MYCME|nr:hypothetical protein [Mycolicibacterium mageritense]TXI56193.1 MAG: hypothetical protein E6Q55_29325 [Mycolicibacterium mageritense]BDY29742.1 hypothetical protein hbim_03682 [Mycolicibacterium mageritense]